MSYWFEDPTLKALAPLALSTSIKGLSTLFFTPRGLCRIQRYPPGAGNRADHHRSISESLLKKTRLYRFR